MQPYFIMYVADQQSSCQFYTTVLQLQPCLNVPGMTEFLLVNGTKLGLMPENGIKRLIGTSLPKIGQGTRAELYLVVSDAEPYHRRAIENGAQELSGLYPRDWGHTVAYSIDADGYVLAFAQEHR